MKPPRRLRLIVSIVGGAPSITAATLLDGGCGEVASEPRPGDATADVVDTSTVFIPTPPIDTDGCNGVIFMMPVPVGRVREPFDSGANIAPYVNYVCESDRIVPKSNQGAKVSLSGFSASARTANGLVRVVAEIEPIIRGLPVIEAVAGDPAFMAMTVSEVQKGAGGFTFRASWPTPFPKVEVRDERGLMIRTRIEVDCGDAATEAITSFSEIDVCALPDGGFDLVSEGGECQVCRVIAEMAPSPIVSDCRGDDLPLGRVLSVRVRPLAGAGNTVVLLAEHDGPDDEVLSFDWRVSGGMIERIAPDIALWSVDGDGDGVPFGQVAMWNDDGAAVENFIWGTT